MNVLNELWYGNISPNSDCRITTKETKELKGASDGIVENARK